MEAIIERFGSDNLLILLVLLVVIILITIVAFIAENKSKNKDKIIVTQPISEQQLEQIVEDKVEEINEEILTEKEEAKQQLEQLKEDLQDPKEEITGPTDFELEQERTAIINYEELKQASLNVDMKDEQLLNDEGNEPISFEDLYQLNKKVELMDFKEEKKEEIPEVYESRFKSSDVISPVYGTREHKNMVNEIKESEFKTSLEIEIAKTERFLRELKELKKKLDQS